MVLKKQSNKVLKLIDNAVKIHSKINNYQNYISPIQVQNLKTIFLFIFLKKLIMIKIPIFTTQLQPKLINK